MTPSQAAPPAPRRQAVVVLGMHRGGTSALAGVLAQLGATPPRTLMRADRENPAGYWESDVIHRIHTQLLVALHSGWDSVAPLPAEWWLSDTATRFADELVDAVSAEFGEAPLFVLKDPRLCRLWPLWTRVLARVDAQPGYVLLTRNPLEVAASLQARDGFTRESSLLLWLRHLLEAELGTRAARRTFLTFASLLENWPDAAQKIAADLAIVWPRPPETCRAEIARFLASDLRHHRIGDHTLLESPTTPAWIRRAYAVAMAAARGSPSSAETTTWDQLRLQLDDADRVMAPLLAGPRASAQPLTTELETARREFRRVEMEREAAVARLAEYERERATFGAQVGRWLTRRRAEWAPVTSLRGRLLSRVMRPGRARFRATPAIGPAPVESQPDDADGVTMSTHGRDSASEPLCDGVILAFALWTLCAHVVVAAGGGLVTLILLYAVAAAAGVALWHRWGSASIAASARAAGPPCLARPIQWAARWLPIGVAATGVAVTLSFAQRPDVLRLWWTAILLLGAFAVVVILREEPRIRHPEPNRALERGLWLLAGASVVLTLVAHRPDSDDALYVNIAVAAVQAPHRALLSGDTLHGIEGLTLLPVYRVHSYELWNGALAYLTGIPTIYVFHWISAAFAAFLVPLAYAKLFRLLTPRWWLWSVGILMLLFVAIGETHRWYGNFAFVRIWQGKAVFLSVILPLIYAYGLRFGVQPTIRGWTLLCAAQIAAVGCTSSALWAAPVSALVAIACTLRPSRQSLKIAAVGLLCSVYVLTQAWLVRANLADVRALWAPASADPSAQLFVAFRTVLGDSHLLLFGIVTLLVAGAVTSPGLPRRFAVISPLVLLVGILNPYAAHWASSSLTGPSYWRAMWALPMPILMTLVLTAPLRLRPAWPRLGRILCLGVVTAFALVVPRYSALSVTNGVHLGWPTLKVPAAPYRWAALINRSVPAGTHIAVPWTIDPWIGTFESHADSVIVRHYLWAKPGVAPDEIQRRVWLRDSVTAPEKVEAAPWQFVEALDRFQVGAVCLANTARADTARAILQEAGFRRTIRDDTYELWLRTPVAVSSDGAVTEHPAAAEADPLSPPGGPSAEPRR